MNPSLLAGLSRIVGRQWVRHRRAELATYAMDGLPTHESTPGVVVMPANPDQVREIVRLLHLVRVPFVARGAGTGLCGGALADPDAVLIALTRMNRILEVDPVHRRAVVQPGVVNARLSDAVLPLGLYYVPDPSSQAACTVGGNVAENAGGPHCLKYGVTTNHIVALEVVLPDGSTARLGSDQGEPWGPDLVGLFVGSEGNVRHRHPDYGSARANSGERPHHAGRLLDCAGRQRGRVGHHRRGHRSGCAGDDGPRLRRGGRSLDLRRRLSHRCRRGSPG